MPFISDADLEQALDEAHVSGRTSDAALGAYQDARIDGLRCRARDPRADGDPRALLRAADPDQAARRALSGVFQKARGVSSAGRAALGERLGGFIYGTILSLAVLVTGAKAYPHDAWKIVLLLAVDGGGLLARARVLPQPGAGGGSGRASRLAELRRIGRHESSIIEAAFRRLQPSSSAHSA